MINFHLANSKILISSFQRAYRISNSKWKPNSLSLKTLFLPTPDPRLKHASGFPNYFFDRYLHTILRIFLLLGLAIPPILIPLNVVDGKNGLEGVNGLDRLSFANVGLSHTDRYWAHLAVAILAVISVCYILQHELHDYARIQCGLRPFGCDGRRGSSLLLISEPNKQLPTNRIRQHFHNVSGGIHTISINRDYSSLRAKLRQRDASIRRLETAETKLIMKANSQRKLRRRAKDEQGGECNISMPLWMKYLHQKDRPSIRLPALPWLPSLPFIGPQVDTIFHFRTEVARYNLDIDWAQRHPDMFPQTNSAFVYFNDRFSTSLGALALKTRIPPTWTLKHGTTPDDMIWHNVSISWWQQFIRTAIAYFLVAVLTLGFAFPVTIIGTLSQIGYLSNVVPWLRWIGELPSWSLAIIQGVLPPAMLGLVTAAVPVAFRLLANAQGLYSRQAIENHVQIYYFTFLFVQVFLAVSLSAGITTIVGQLSATVQAIPAVLAQNLPKACNYFFSYIMMYTFTTIVSTLLQAQGLVNLLVLSPAFDKTLREKWIRQESLNLQKWGTFIPVFTNIACIGVFLLG